MTISCSLSLTHYIASKINNTISNMYLPCINHVRDDLIHESKKHLSLLIKIFDVILYVDFKIEIRL
jgi:hypothetical protein